MNAVQRWLKSIESRQSLDAVAERLRSRVRPFLRERPGLDRALRGKWLGHPAHPALVAMPIGCYGAAAVCDLLGRRVTARHLISLGLLTVPPAAITGLADWSELDLRQRRVGFVHASANIASSVCYLMSWTARHRSNDTAGRGWALLGLLTVSAAGAIGGHLAYAQGAGVFRWSRPAEAADGPAGPMPRTPEDDAAGSHRERTSGSGRQ
ncbi:DUF2231 domain-containing protein [Actinoalloteichus hymeniacidonis]|uniref:Membrane protein n=1 Tax=Actinoalloteichus hymeniacidonis TaxID=340345 RepID=A0AAC9HPT8_9PSEU|nr:DUF2231 domain-containing protein [Actinoalloteichus hymeniacidonis]AOS63259.1 putative membrane protein [Actinoalloteichus hymeniacidonis]MBB5908702.1 putative membrane protein [Actinoalloteichus hymeniacidonis]